MVYEQKIYNFARILRGFNIFDKLEFPCRFKDVENFYFLVLFAAFYLINRRIQTYEYISHIVWNLWKPCVLWYRSKKKENRKQPHTIQNILSILFKTFYKNFIKNVCWHLYILPSYYLDIQYITKTHPQTELNEHLNI